MKYLLLMNILQAKLHGEIIEDGYYLFDKRQAIIATKNLANRVEATRDKCSLIFI